MKRVEIRRAESEAHIQYSLRAGMPIEHEFAQERAAALGRVGRTLDQALRELARFDAAHSSTAASSKQARTHLVRQASEALWCFVVQREACGLRDMRALLRDYSIPAEVVALMGARDATNLTP